MPTAPYASAATRPRPSWKPPAATTGTRTRSTVCDTSSVVGNVPVWPPPSPPCTTITSAPSFSAFCACLRVAAGRDAQDTRFLEPADQCSARRAVVAGGAHAVPDDRVGDDVGARRVHQEVHAEGPVGERLHLLDLVRHVLGPDRRRREEAERARVRHRRDELGRRHPSHSRLDDRHADAEQIAERRVEAGSRASPGLRDRAGRRDRGLRGSGAAPRRSACASSRRRHPRRAGRTSRRARLRA